MGLALAALLVCASPAGAVTFEVTHTYAGASGDVSVAAGPGGVEYLAWSGNGVQFAARTLGGEFGEPQQVAPEGRDVQVARGADGLAAVAWVGQDYSSVHVAVWMPGGAIGQDQEVPLPPRPPLAGEDGLPRFIVLPRVAVAADGTVAIGYTDSDQSVISVRAVVVVRHPDGSFAAPQILGSSSLGLQLRSDSEPQAVYALWAEAGDIYGSPRRIMTADWHGGGAFTTRKLADLAVTPPVSFIEPALAVDQRGDMAAAWGENGSDGSALGTSRRPAGGDWSAPLRAPTFTARPAIAIGEHGDVTAAWAQGLTLAFASWPAGADAQAIQTMPVARSVAESLVAGPNGSALIARQLAQSAGGPSVVAAVRAGSGCFSPDVMLAGPQSFMRGLAAAGGPDGSGAIVWAESDRVHVQPFRIGDDAPTACPAGDPGLSVRQPPGPLALSVSGVPARVRAAALRRSGLLVRSAVNRTALIGFELRDRSGPLTVDLLGYGDGERALRLRVRRALRRGAKLVLNVTAVDDGGEQVRVTRRITLK